MSLYDAMENMHEKRITQSPTGDTPMEGIVIGTVTKNYHRDMPGRICVSIPQNDQDANELQWVRLIHPSGGETYGHHFVPEVGDQVAVLFEGNHIEKPYVIGCVQKDGGKFLKQAVTEKNEIKRITTKNGNTITFEDHAGDSEGKKDKITISTAKKSHTLLMDNENNIMRLTDQPKENYLEIRTEAGQTILKAKSKLTIQVGDTIKITLNGETGSIKVSAKEVGIDAGQRVKWKTDGQMYLEGAQISVKASSLLKEECSGMVSIAGTPIKIG